MHSRALTACLLAVLFGCIGTDGLADKDAAGALPSQSESLMFEATDHSLLPNKELELVVIYRDANGEPRAGVPVDFALVGSAQGASLSPSRSVTEMDGTARTTLRAGSTAMDLDVRARAGDSGYDLITISVRPALGTRLMVGVHYSGTRDIASFTVTSLPEMACAQALSSGLAGEYSYNFNAADQRATFDLGYGLKSAIVGWGRDATGAKLVRGCKDVTAPTTANEEEAQSVLTLELADIELSLVDALALELEVNVASSAHRFEDACKRAVAGVLSPDAAYSMFADADFLLDAVQAELTAQGNVAAAAELASRRLAASLSASLQPALASAGPSAYGAAIGEDLAQRGASLTLRWSLSSALQSTLSAFTALSADGSQALSFPSLPLVDIVASFLADAAQLDFSTLKVKLGLGAYGRALLTGIDADSRAQLGAKAGCADVFASWWTKSALLDIASASAAQAACTSAVAKLDAAMQTELGKLDAASPTLALGGKAQAHDRSDDGKVDDLGPSALTGQWGADLVQAELRVPSRTAFQ